MSETSTAPTSLDYTVTTEEHEFAEGKVLSLETGNVWQLDETPHVADLRVAGSLWFGMDSILGPIYAGYGLADGGDSSFYLFLGRIFGPLRRF